MFTPLKIYPDTEFETMVIANSQTITVGDAIATAATGNVKFATGAGSNTTHLLGVVVAILKDGAISELNSIAAPSGNQTATSGQYSVQYIPLCGPPIKFRATLSAAAGTTTDSDGIGVSFAMYSTNGVLDESSVALPTATMKVFTSLGVDLLTDTSKKTVIGYFTKTLS